MQNTITPVTFRRLQFSHFFWVLRASNFSHTKATDEVVPRFFPCRNLPRANAQKTHPRRHRGCCCFGYIHPPPFCTVSCNRTCLLRTSYSIFNHALKLNKFTEKFEIGQIPIWGMHNHAWIRMYIWLLHKKMIKWGTIHTIEQLLLF